MIKKTTTAIKNSDSVTEKTDRYSKNAREAESLDQALFNKNILDLLMRMGKQMESQQKNVQEMKNRLSTVLPPHDMDKINETHNIDDTKSQLSQAITQHEKAIESMAQSMMEIENKINLIHKRQERSNKDIEQALKSNMRLITQIERIEQNMSRLTDSSTGTRHNFAEDIRESLSHARNNIFIRELITTPSASSEPKIFSKTLQDEIEHDENIVPPFSNWGQQKIAANKNENKPQKSTKGLHLFSLIMLALALLSVLAIAVVFAWNPTTSILKTTPSKNQIQGVQKETTSEKGTKRFDPKAQSEKTMEDLAKELNNIEPSSAPDKTKLSDDFFDSSDLIPSQKETSSLSKISKDNTLPAAAKSLEALAIQGVADAQHDLASLYISGKNDVPLNYEKARQWFEKAAAQGVSNAQYNLGVIYQQGLGIPASPKSAVEWYKKAAEQEHPEAQYNLAMAFIEGMGVPYNPEQAAVYFKKAALSTKTTIPEAAYNYGMILENQLIKDANPQEALRWYKKAAESGSERAQSAMEQLSNYLQKDISQIKSITPSQATVTANAAAVDTSEKTSSEKTIAKTKEKKAKKSTQKVKKQSSKQVSTKDQDNRLLFQQTQIELKRLGLYPGATDGNPNSVFRDAVKSYQILAGMKPTGWTSSGLVEDLRHKKSLKAQ